MRNSKQKNYQPVSFDAIKISLADPDLIRGSAREHKGWSYGEVTKPETINYRTLKPEKDGLFCEKIFGPSKDFECHCGKYKKAAYKGTICDRCGVEVTKSIVRRERMGHIELAAPVSHIWYFKGIPSRMGLILDISPRVLEKVLYFANYIVLDKGETDLEYKQVLSEKEYQEAKEKWGTKFRAGMGAEAVKELLIAIDVEKEYEELKAELNEATGQKKARLIKRFEVIQAFRESGNEPSWMILDCIPVIPPDLRPMVQLDGGRFATSDLNDLYRRIINRNNRLKRLLELGAPDIIVRNEKRMLQEAVDALIDNGRRGRPVTGPGNRALKSLSDMLKGKNGRFRQNLLGKRVDYSGRTVIVNGPELKIYQCGVPKEMALELFKPFVMKELEQRGISQNVKNAKKLVERQDPQVWDVLEDVIKEHPVMLNRAPTLHRLGIQAFEPVLIEGKAIKLHPLVCAGFNADFDGDQMAIHLPLSEEAQAECRFLLLSSNNLLKPSDGQVVSVPSQDMILGIYYLTQEIEGVKGTGNYYHNLNEAILAYENGECTLQSRIHVRVQKKMPDGTVLQDTIESTLGRFLFNEIIPQDLGFVDRSVKGNELKLEIDFMVKKKDLKKILQAIINVHGTFKTAEIMDLIKSIGYHYSTRAAMTVSIADIIVPENKNEILEEGQKTVDEIQKNYRRGLVTEEERYKAVVDTWTEVDKKLTDATIGTLDKYNNIFMMADSGARGSNQQIKQLAGMRGLMADTQGRTIELPIKSNFREGLDVLEYFMAAHGARKGLSDTALRTADSGYLTRRMVDVSQELIIREQDCSEGKDVIPGMPVYAFVDGNEVLESLEDRITGRYSCDEIRDKDGNVLVKKNHMITPARAKKVVSSGVDENGEPLTQVKIRTILTCRSHLGICAKCYGANMATGEPVQVGEAVGIIAAQAIGEPGTQLTMRTFHTGGVAGSNITQGLPRVEELFEARKPKGLAIIAEFGGKVKVNDSKKSREVVVTNADGETKTYPIPYGSRIKVIDDQEIVAGDELTEGSVNPHDLLKIKGIQAVEDYLLREVQRVYRLQGVDICDKHIEVIVRQMLKKVRIEEQGDSEFMPGSLIDIIDFEDNNEKLVAEGKRPAEGTRIILGITKAALATDSFLSAASFQETTKVLTDAAIHGKVDPLIGLKENVIIGKLIPAGTGMKRYRKTKLSTDNEPIAEEEAVDTDAEILSDGSIPNDDPNAKQDPTLDEEVVTEEETAKDEKQEDAPARV
ncbi:MAG: DNA-directed RNA polymerase subunit beta' [Lachnospiraceae bacterium]|jgi:DNA-directed RNA polymerase subunit beta'|nr:DNA-directed RNA polymerase subunit beta' [Lachnospiraceae bacterium]MCH4029526.1 DNA-directed RNA polymerase subunit beta' [Lachnospiraceae bacterium]MCH4067624.1 DNA-directed RNA polymerase subunit beta' [Lachnospiraceae bacterium]MCH4113647.1 DNA-directed RNA polymerase subunit beta' [Lachnospiraceae bacterium]MCI1353854.1 DNA-directed RNA polymerase subunit beta' [Lachnospiraceae bacterium]